MKSLKIIAALLCLSAGAEEISKLEYNKDIVPILDKYCYKCHDNDVQKGDLNMVEALNIPDTIAKNHKIWEKVIEQVHTGEMPPKKPFMPPVVTNKLLDWLRYQMKNIDWSTHKNAGHVTLPRLNRLEYNNTIRDLLGWDRKPGSKFGEDGIGDSGFNNDRDGLFVSASQAEKYFEAAEKLMDDYVNSGLPPERKVIEAENMLITDELTVPQKWGYLIGRNQDTVYTFVPITRKGYYELTVRAWGQRNKSDSVAKMKVLVNNFLKAETKLNSTPENPGDYKLIIYLDEGNHQISFNGVRTTANPEEARAKVYPLKDISSIYGNIPLGKSAESMCTMGKTFMALDKISLVGPLKELPAEVPTKLAQIGTGKIKSGGKPFEKNIVLEQFNLKTEKKGLKKKASNYNKAMKLLQSKYNALRKKGPKADPFELQFCIDEIIHAKDRAEKSKSYLLKDIGKDIKAFQQFEQSIKATQQKNFAIVNAAKKMIPKNLSISAEEKAAFTKKYSGTQWLYCRDAHDFVAPPSLKKVFFTRPGNGQSERQAAEKIVERFASRAFRKAVTKDEIAKYMTLFDAEKEKGQSYKEAIKLPMAAILISPHFLYRSENAPAPKKEFKLDNFQLANRLSYFLWMSMPDDALFELAKAGNLSKPDVLRAQIKRMIQSPKLKAFTKTFGEQWLGYHELGKSKVPDEMVFPKFTEDLRKDMFIETEMFIHDLISNNGSMLNVLDSDYSYINERLAKHYGIKGVQGTEFQRVKLKDKNRGGVLGMGSILATTSQPVRTSPVDRGTWVLETLMGKHLPEPPADIPPLPENAGGEKAELTLRQSLEQHRDNDQCRSCHDKIDPIGFGLENFDPIGRFRTKNFGRKIDAQGKLPSGETFTNPAELKSLIVKRENDFARNMAERFLSFALGRKLEFYDEPVLRELATSFHKSGFKAHKLIEDVVMSYPFQHQSHVR